MLFLALIFSSALRSVHAQPVNGPIPPAPSPAPGLVERCDPLVDCLPYSKRFQYSLDFLCCETGAGWVAAHVANPLGVSFFFGSFAAGLAIAFWFEAIEITFLTAFTGFVIFETRELDLETWAGSIIGDALIQGGIGAFLGYLLRTAFNVPGPFESWPLMNSWLRFKYAGLWILYSCSFILVQFVGENGEHWGLFGAIGFHAVFLFVILPFSTRSRLDEAVVWQNRVRKYKYVRGPYRVAEKLRVEHVPESRRWSLYSAWFFINAALASQTTGLYYYLPSDYYQVWIAASLSILVLVLVIALRNQKK